jgi:hypothetical protein
MPAQLDRRTPCPEQPSCISLRPPANVHRLRVTSDPQPATGSRLRRAPSCSRLPAPGSRLFCCQICQHSLTPAKSNKYAKSSVTIQLDRSTARRTPCPERPRFPELRPATGYRLPGASPVTLVIDSLTRVSQLTRSQSSGLITSVNESIASVIDALALASQLTPFQRHAAYPADPHSITPAKSITVPHCPGGRGYPQTRDTLEIWFR